MRISDYIDADLLDRFEFYNYDTLRNEAVC